MIRILENKLRLISVQGIRILICTLGELGSHRRAKQASSAVQVRGSMVQTRAKPLALKLAIATRDSSVKYWARRTSYIRPRSPDSFGTRVPI